MRILVIVLFTTNDSMISWRRWESFAGRYVLTRVDDYDIDLYKVMFLFLALGGTQSAKSIVSTGSATVPLDNQT